MSHTIIAPARDLVALLRVPDAKRDSLKAAMSQRSDIAPAPPRASTQHEALAAPDLASALKGRK